MYYSIRPNYVTFYVSGSVTWRSILGGIINNDVKVSCRNHTLRVLLCDMASNLGNLIADDSVDKIILSASTHS